MNKFIAYNYQKVIQARERATEKYAIQVIKKIVALFPQAQKIQPKITGLNFGMGSWGFDGKAIGHYNDENPIEKTDIDNYTLKRYLIEGNDRFVVTMSVNKELKETAELCEYLVDYSENGLNYSTMIDGVDHRGVIFIREVKPKSPFGHEPKATLLKSSLYKNLKKAGVKCVVITEK